MNKTKILLFYFIAILIVSGCNSNIEEEDKYANFEHYDLRNYSHTIYTYIRNSNGNQNDLDVEHYAISVLSPIGQEMEGYMNGLLYEVGGNDYILLYSFLGEKEARSNDIIMYKDKIYTSNLSALIIEYTLDKENTKRKELIFDVSNILDAEILNYSIDRIVDVDDENIYLNSRISGYNGDILVADLRDVSLKCSLENYVCELAP